MARTKPEVLLVVIPLAAVWGGLGILKLSQDSGQRGSSFPLHLVGVFELATAVLLLSRFRALGLVVSLALASTFLITSFLPAGWTGSFESDCGCFGASIRAHGADRRLLAGLLWLGSTFVLTKNPTRRTCVHGAPPRHREQEHP